MTLPTQRAFIFDDAVYHVVFFATDGVRLVKGAESGEPISVVECHILDADLDILVEGRALKSADDTYDARTGFLLSLSRALDAAEYHMPVWTRSRSYDVLQELMEQMDFRALDTAPAAVWKDWMHANTHVEEAKVLLAWMTQPQTVAPSAPEVIVWQCADGGMRDSYWVWDGAPHYMRRSEQFKLHPSHFGAPGTPDGLDGGRVYRRVPDPRVSLPALSLNDQFRRDADRLGVDLDNPTGALTMRDLSKLYHAMMRNRSLPSRNAVDIDALNDVMEVCA